MQHIFIIKLNSTTPYIKINESCVKYMRCSVEFISFNTKCRFLDCKVLMTWTAKMLKIFVSYKYHDGYYKRSSNHILTPISITLLPVSDILILRFPRLLINRLQFNLLFMTRSHSILGLLIPRSTVITMLKTVLVSWAVHKHLILNFGLIE